MMSMLLTGTLPPLVMRAVQVMVPPRTVVATLVEPLYWYTPASNWPVTPLRELAWKTLVTVMLLEPEHNLAGSIKPFKVSG